MTSTPKPFEVHESGALLHGTKADLSVGDLLLPGCRSNYAEGRLSNHVYVTHTLDAAVWGAELATGQGRCRIYIVEPEGTLEDDPNVTDKRFPGNPTRSYRTREPVRIVGEITDWVGHSPEQLQAMRSGLADLERRGLAVIYDQILVRRVESENPDPRTLHLVIGHRSLMGMHQGVDAARACHAASTDGPSDQTLPIARDWGAQPTPQYIQFTAVEPVGPETINANGQGQVDGMEPYPVGPIPFVRYNNEWKLSRAFVCGGLFLAVPQVCD